MEPDICVACGTQHNQNGWSGRIRVTYVKGNGLTVGNRLRVKYKTAHENVRSKLKPNKKHYICNRMYKVSY